MLQSDLQSIIERLERATGSDDRLNGDIWWAVDRKRAEVAFWNAATGLPRLLGDEMPEWLGKLSVQVRAPKYTKTIDAALKLVLPGWTWRVASCSVSDDAWVMPDFNDPTHGERFKSEWPDECQRDPIAFLDTDIDLRPSGRPAIALCIAALKGIQADRARSLSSSGKGE